MDQLELKHYTGDINHDITITGSKSESNRLLILKQFLPDLSLKNVSSSDDTQLMLKALANQAELVNIGHAGTTMRFLTSYLASQPGVTKVLTGSKRMTERPIQLLVNALVTLGADISYEGQEGYPPLRINGKKLVGGAVQIPGNISSQYISSLLLIAPTLEKGLQLELVGEITSVPYIKMTLSLLESLGVQTKFEGQFIFVSPGFEATPSEMTVESDWSSASYYFSLVALSKSGKISLGAYKNNSLQGDSVLVDLYKEMGVHASIENEKLTLEKLKDFKLPERVAFNLVKAPDIAQTIAVTCFGLGIACDLTGLHTLKIKETDRLVALENELTKLGAQIRITEDSLHLEPSTTIKKGVAIDTYQDHRMAMAFAPLLLKTNLVINDPAVVSKSYPDFWEHFKQFQPK